MDYDYELDYSDFQEGYYYGEYDENSMSLDQVYRACLKPSIYETVNALSHLFLWCFIYRLSRHYLSTSTTSSHLLSSLTGLLSLYSLFSSSTCYILFLISLTYLILFTTSYCKCERYCSVILIAISLFYICACELWLVDEKEWHQIRGSQMIVLMKSISLTFDIDMGKVKVVPNLLSYAGYTLCPSSCIFGPWISYNQYNVQYKEEWNFKSWGNIISKLFLAFTFLTISTCWCEYFIPSSDWKWLSAFRDALSFRTSHYFISYLSEVTLLLSGYSTTMFSVTKPMLVEFPRSLVNVVIYWNIPMHNWLKTYIFSTSKKFGNFIAVFVTYAVSSLLHGISFQLSAVLLSLGAYSYVEVMLRKRLSTVFNACVLAKNCRQNCGHKYNKYHPLVFLCNTLLVFLTVFHLAYLGVVFDSSQEQETGYHWQHSLRKWATLDYLSHYVAFLTYLMYILIK